MKKLFWLILISVFAIILFAWWQSRPRELKNEVAFLDVGQGDAALITFKNGPRVLVDCGINAEILSRLPKFLPFFDRRIDYLFITHPDADHYGGCLNVLENYEVSHVVLNGETKDDEYGLRFFEEVKNEGIEVKIISQNEKWRVNNESEFEFFSPVDSFGSLSGNDRSLVFALVSEKKKFLFVGDLENEGEKLLLNYYCGNSTTTCPKLKSDVLKIGHHGSDTSSGKDFLSAVLPSQAIISVGENSFGHPSLRTLRKLERLSVEVLRTDKLGDIIIKDW